MKRMDVKQDPNLRLESLHGREARGIVGASLLPEQARFGRLFDLAPRGDVNPTPTDLGLPNGPMDGGAGHNDSTKLPAVLPYFGQFVDHDITLDLSSDLEKEADPRAVTKFRTPNLELDSVYGLGPAGSPHLYDRNAKNKLLVGMTSDNAREADLPRNTQGVALLGDARNDDNLIVAQVHVAMLKFHNVIVDHLPSLDDGVYDASEFAKAQRLTRWHYQWLVFHHFLPAIVGKSMVADILARGRKLYTPPGVAFIPVEFSGAAYRFGHSMVQPGYAINDGFGAVLFPADASAPATFARSDLRGGPIGAKHVVNWKNFLRTDVPASSGAVSRFSSKIDRRLTAVLLNLPHSVVPAQAPASQRSLAFRDLQRGTVLGLPSGQDVAQEIRKRAPESRVLSDEELWQGTTFHGQKAPLLYYILREAEVQHGGEQLGDVGGRIVAEVLIGLLQLDPLSFLAMRPTWRPVAVGRRNQADFDFFDFFKLAGTDVD